MAAFKIEVLYRGPNSLFLRETLEFGGPLPIVVLCSGVKIYGKGMPQPFLHSSVWVFPQLPDVTSYLIGIAQLVSGFLSDGTDQYVPV